MNLLSAFLIGGFAGWALENLAYGDRYSNAFGKENRVPFLPIYGAGAVAILALAPHLTGMSWPARGAVYAGALSALEYAACQMDRRLGPTSWDYGDGACVDGKHAVLWGLLGLGAEKVRL